MAETAKKEKKILTERQRERRKAIADALKSMIFPAILLALIAVGIFVVINYQGAPEEEEIVPIRAYTGDEQAIILENDQLKLTMDPLTTQFDLEVKSSGKVWHSTPEDAASDPIALTDEKGRLQSPLLMAYSVTTGLVTPYSSYNESIDNGIYEIEQADDALTVHYSLGDVEKEYVIPTVTTEERFNRWLSQMTEANARIVKQIYKKYDINKLGKKDNREELVANYPVIETEVIYVLRDTAQESVKRAIQGYFEEAGYTYEEFLTDKEFNNAERSSDKPIFDIDVTYRLEGGDLVVEVPFSSLESKSDYPIYTITPLPYFGAGGAEDAGFLLVPEGGGALIDFNNGKVSQSSYYANLYGWDMCISREAVVHNTRATCGVFGISAGDDAFLCLLEDGRAYAAVQADIAGKSNSYNYVNAVYSITQREQYDVGDIATSAIYRYQEELPDETIRQRYRFVDSGSYVDMAKVYGAYLQDEYGDALAMNSDTAAPLAVEIVGAIDKVKQIVGVPVSRPLKLTTFDEAAEIVRDLAAQGAGNLSVKLTGWCNGGVNQKILKHVNVLSQLGGKRGLARLAQATGDAGATLYLDGVTQYAFDSNLTNGFFSYRDAAKLISRERAEEFPYSHVTYAAREYADPYFLLHTELALKMADNLTNAAADYSAGVSFADTGKDLSSDFYRKNFYSRQSVLGLQQAQLKALDDAGTPVMINMGNDYAVPYAHLVTGADLRGSEYTILDQCIPFYQLAVHGRVDYTGEALNLCGDPEEELLNCAEYGAGLFFTFMHESAFTTQKTLYSEYYGANYESWRDEALAIYARYNSELGHTFSQEMTGHENLTDVVSRTDYADGTRVYVNRGYSAAAVDDVEVPARDYLVMR